MNETSEQYPHDEERLVAALLQRAHDEIDLPSDARERVRQAAFAAHDEVAGLHLEGSIAPQGHSQVIDLTTRTHIETNSPLIRRIVWQGVAACLVLLAGYVLYSSDGGVDGSGDRVVPADNQGLPYPLDVGTHRSDVLGTGVEFTTSQPLWVIAEQPGLIELAVDPEDSSGSRLWLVGPSNRVFAGEPTSAVEFFEPLVDELGAQLKPTVVAGRETNSWRVRATGGSERECEDDRPCISLIVEPFEIGLVTGRFTDVFEVPDGDEPGDSMLIVNWVATNDWSPQYGAPFRDVIDSLSFDD